MGQGRTDREGERERGGERVVYAGNSFDPMFATMRARKRAKSSCSIVHSIGLTTPSDIQTPSQPLLAPARIIRNSRAFNTNQRTRVNEL